MRSMAVDRVAAVLLVLTAVGPLEAQMCTGAPMDGYRWQVNGIASEKGRMESLGAGAGWNPTPGSGIAVAVTRDAMTYNRLEVSGSTIRMLATREVPVDLISLCVGVGIIRASWSGRGPALVGCTGFEGFQCPPIVFQSYNGWRMPVSAKAGYAINLPWGVRMGSAATVSRELRHQTIDVGPPMGSVATNWHGSWHSESSAHEVKELLLAIRF